MNRSGLGLLIVIVLATNAFVLVGVARNRSGEPDARIELTERELSIPFEWEDRIGNENTGLALRLRWNMRGVYPSPWFEPDWFDEKKLEELGFDCSEPVAAPEAGMKYDRMLPSETYAVLEHDGDSWKQWQARREMQLDQRARKVERREETPASLEADRKDLERSRRTMSRLFVVDVGNDAVALRKQYSDRGRFIIAPALVRLQFLASVRDPEHPSAPEQPAKVRGSVAQILVNEVHVPRSMRRFLDEVMAAQKAERERNKEAMPYVLPEDREPRYAVTIQYGRRYEPWVVDVRPLEANR